MSLQSAEAGLLRAALTALSPAGGRGRLSIFYFHRVLPEIDPMLPDEPDVQRFGQTVGWIASWFRVIALSEAIARLKSGTLPSRAAAITFDDGYADNYTQALPVLRSHGLTATFFIATGFIERGRMWNDTVIEAIRRTSHESLDLSGLGLGRFALRSVDQRRAVADSLLHKIKHLEHQQRTEVVGAIEVACAATLPMDLMLSGEEIRGLSSAGMEVGAHTHTHPILTRLDDASARKEISSSRELLRDLTGQTIELFAYPNGLPGRDFDGRHVAMVRDAGFRGAVTTAAGASDKDADCLQLPRFTPWDRTRQRFGIRCLGNYWRSGADAFRAYK